MVAAPSQHMSIHAIVACRDLAVRKPLPVIVSGARLECFGGSREGFSGVLVPVQVGGLLGPERFRIAEGVVLNFVLGMGRHYAVFRKLVSEGICLWILGWLTR